MRCFLRIWTASLFCFGIANAQTLTNDVTAYVETISTNPFPSALNSLPYVRNVWSMFPFHGLLYLGYGNASNLEPEPYGGAVEVIAFNPVSGKFTNQYNMPEQQVDHYRVFDGQLVSPGFNPDGFVNGNGDFYIQESNTWNRVATIPGATHTFDIYDFQGVWFAGLGKYGSNIVSSTNQGATWNNVMSADLAGEDSTGNRVLSFFELNNTLYSVTMVLLPDFNLGPTILSYDTNQELFNVDGLLSDFGLANFCPNTLIPLGLNYCIARATNVNDNLLYLLGVITNDMQWDPVALYWAANVDAGIKVNLPPETKPWDILQTGNHAWVLTSTPVEGSSNYWVQVVGTDVFEDDGNGNDDFTNNWRELLRFQCSTFARSFALLNGDFYFGLGCETNLLSPATGGILRVKAQYFQPTVSASFSGAGVVDVLAQCPTDQSLVVEESSDLKNWMPVFTNLTVGGTLSWSANQSSSNALQFYRCLVGP